MKKLRTKEATYAVAYGAGKRRLLKILRACNPRGKARAIAKEARQLHADWTTFRDSILEVNVRSIGPSSVRALPCGAQNMCTTAQESMYIEAYVINADRSWAHTEFNSLNEAKNWASKMPKDVNINFIDENGDIFASSIDELLAME